jgi:hypothetical protein
MNAPVTLHAPPVIFYTANYHEREAHTDSANQADPEQGSARCEPAALSRNASVATR